MRDERNSLGKKSGADISADDLLARLKQSFDDAGETKKERPDPTAKQYDKSLMIDDDVYREAENRLHTSEAVTAMDDSDLDIDELIDMYITKPRAEREARAAKEDLPPVDENGDNIVHELDIEGAVEAIDALYESEVPAEVDAIYAEDEGELFDTDGEAADEYENEAVLALDAETTDFEEQTEDVCEELFDEPELDDAWTEPDAIEELELIDGAASSDVIEAVLDDEAVLDASAAEDVDAVIDEAFAFDGDDDMKLAEPVQENALAVADFEEEPNTDDVATAVFDISQIKHMTDGDDDLDSVIDAALAQSATEVFTPVNEADLDNLDAEQDDTRVYGQPDGEEIDQTDLHIMLAFGMEDQLKETVGEEKATEIEDDIIQKHQETSQINAVKEKIEYITRDQNDEIMNDYESRYKSLLIRMAAAVALLLCTFFIENFSLFGLTLPEFMRPTSYPIVYAMIDLQLVVFSGILVYKQILDGSMAVLKKKTLPETITAVMLVLSVIYTFVTAFTAPVEGFALYNLPVVLTVLLALIYEFMNLKREVYSFNIVSSNNKKFVITPVSDATESLEREVFNDYVSNEAQIIRAGKTEFVDGFFERSAWTKISKPIVGIALSIVGAAALVFAVLAAFSGKGVYGAFTMAFLTVVLSAPLTLLFVFAYPFYKASKDAFANDSAIIGECSFNEYSGSAVISFEDKEVFPSRGVKVTSIKVFGQNRIDEIIYNVASAFIKVGGPLADVFSQATHDMGYSEDVEFVEVDDDGFTVTVDDELVYIGKASYMEKKDYEPPYDSEGRKQEQNSSVGVLFIAFRGQLAAKIYVTYTIDREFEKILGQLYKTGMCVGIKSFDPNIDDLLLSKKIRAIKYPVKVIRAKTVEDIPHTLERCESGVVSRRSVKSLLRTVALCERVSSVIKTDLAVGILSMIIGAVVMIFIHAFGLSGVFPSLYALLYQLFWLIPVAVISKLLV